MNVIQIEDLWKEYRLGVIGHGTLTQDLQSWWAKILGKEDPNSRIASLMKGQEDQIDGDRFWALQDINLEIKEGALLGIIGKNGAGKSTLLKILSRVTAPTRGNIKIKGHMASLLEVGTGFHPELTGRENVFLNGAILGMSKKEISKKFIEIVDFSGIEQFIDTPVKRYSSGMYVRLAFAVAAYLDPEILIIDEVLAVGDADFQKKCLGKMGDVAKEGRTVLFVSHNMYMISALCQKSISLYKGKIKKIGKTSEVILDYLSSSCATSSSVDFEKTGEIVGDQGACLLSARIVDLAQCVVSEVDIGESFKIVVEYEVRISTKVVPYFHIKTIGGVHVMSVSGESIAPEKPGKYLVECLIPGHFLNDGSYTVGISGCSFEKGLHPHFIANEILSFNIVEQILETRGLYTGKHGGVVRPRLDWLIENVG